MSNNVHVIDHPLVQHKLSLLRKKETSTHKFRSLLRELSLLLGYEVTRNFKTTLETIETPMTTMEAPFLTRPKPALISILRAGNGILDGMLQLLPSAKVGHIGLYREEKANSIVEYYFKVPDDIALREVLVLDPMLATGQSAVIAVNRLKKKNPRKIYFVCILAAPEGIEYFQSMHPDVPIYTASIDAKLNEKNYIIPGLGDAGDRLYGTQ
jgi:uracil phosphoribosyltransferase